jgi:hypothetical protein
MSIETFIDKHVAPFAWDAFVPLCTGDPIFTGVLPRVGYVLFLVKLAGPDDPPAGWTDRGEPACSGAVPLRCYSRVVARGDRELLETLEVIGERLRGVVACDG